MKCSKVVCRLAIYEAGVFCRIISAVSVLVKGEDTCTLQAGGCGGPCVPMGQVCTGPLSIDLLTLESCGRLDRNSVGYTGKVLVIME